VYFDIKNTKAFFHFKDDRSLKLIIFFRINSLNNCINHGPNKNDKNSGLIFFFLEKETNSNRTEGNRIEFFSKKLSNIWPHSIDAIA